MILTLFLSFIKIGLFTFGGGYAMIPIIENICVDRKKWITHEEMMDGTGYCYNSCCIVLWFQRSI